MKYCVFNRILSFLLAVLMLCSNAPIPAFSVGREKNNQPQNMDQSGAPEVDVFTPNRGIYGALIGADAVFNWDKFSLLVIADDPTVELDAGQDLVATDVWGVDLMVEDVYWVAESCALWLKVAAKEGQILPAKLQKYPWVFQNYTDLYVEPDWESNYPDALVLTLPEGGQMDMATGITVSGANLPENATVSVRVPKIGDELPENMYDIKVLVPDENGELVEWQPIEHEQTVQISIPILEAEEGIANVLHFVDYAADINGDEIFLPVADVKAEDLALLQPALDAYAAVYGNRDYVAVEEYSNVAFKNGTVTIETDSFSVYTPQYVKEEVNEGDVFTVTFESYSDQADPANERTYYVTKGTTVKFKTTWNQGKNWTITMINGTVNEDIDDTATTGTNIPLLHIGWGTSTCTIGFDKAEIQVGDLFEIRWVTDWSSEGKNPRWTRIMIVEEYPSTFNANGGVFPDGNTTINQTIVSYQPVNMFTMPTREGYIFKGWAITQDATDSQIFKTTDKFPGTMEANTTFYAQWEPVEYQVNYVLPADVGNGASFVSQTKYHDQPLLLHNMLPMDIDTDTKFQGWDITGDGVVDIDRYQIVAGYWYTGNADLNVVGIWDDAVHTIIYNANGGSDAPPTQYLDTSLPGDRSVKLSDHIPTRPGYVFTGWDTAADGKGTDYAAGDTISNVDGNITLYAQWEALYYAIVFAPNGGTTGTMGEMLALTYEDLTAERYYTNYYANLLINNFGRDGYKFMGWALTAQDANNGVVHFGNGENVKVSDLVDQMLREGIELSGKDVDKIVHHNDDNHTYKHQVITLHAVWAQASYTIQYTANEEGVSISNLTQTAIVGSRPTINSTASRSRYTFAGWRDEDGNIYGYGDPFDDKDVTDGQVIVLTATWKFNVIGYMYSMISGAPVQNGSIWVDGDNKGSMYTLTIDGSSPVPAITFKPDEGYKIVEVRIEDETYTAGNGLVLAADGSYVYEGLANCTAPLYIAVRTEPETYTVTWTNWDGTVLYKAEGVTYGTMPTYPYGTPTRPDGAHESYIFAGWEPAIVPVTGDITYKATYALDLDEYVVNWIVDGATVKTDTVEYGYTVIVPGGYEKAGYTFAGWNTQENGEGTSYAVGDYITVTAPMELYAQWIQSSTSLTISVSGGAGYTFLFQIKQINLLVVVHGGSQVTIDGLDVGIQYTVEELSGWSWRHNISGNTSITLSANANDNSLTFTAKGNDSGWLGGESSNTP